MSFIATTNPPVKGTEGVVFNDGFFPDVDCERLRADARIETTVTPPRLTEAIEAAMWAINNELATWQALQLASGFATLADVPASVLGKDGDAESVKVKQYRNAIKWHVMAETAEASRDMSTLPQGAGKESRVMSGIETRVDGFHQKLRWAVADLQGRSRVIAELI